MLRIEDAVRVVSNNGKKYYHLCKKCNKEIGPNQRSALKTRTGYCNKCHKQAQHHPGKYLLTRIKHSARNRTTVSLTEDQAAELKEICVCHYCGGPIKWNRSSINLDRKDPNTNYNIDNVVVCCFACNKVKSNVLSYEEMRIAMHAVRLFRLLNETERKELELTLLDYIAP